MKRHTITHRGTRLLRVSMAVMLLLTTTALIPARAEGPSPLGERTSALLASLQHHSHSNTSFNTGGQASSRIDLGLLPSPDTMLPPTSVDTAFRPQHLRELGVPIHSVAVPAPQFGAFQQLYYADPSLNAASGGAAAIFGENFLQNNGLGIYGPEKKFAGKGKSKQYTKEDYAKAPAQVEALLQQSFLQPQKAWVDELFVKAGVDPNTLQPFKQQPSIPAAGLSSFEDPLYTGPAFSSFSPPVDVLATLGFNSSSPSSFGSQFATNINNLLYAPGAQTEPLPRTLMTGPINASPGITTFRNLTVFTVIAYGVTPDGQQMSEPTEVMLPGESYDLFTYIGLFWRLYAFDGVSIAWLGDVEVKQPFSVYDITLPLAGTSIPAAAANIPRLDIIGASYSAIGDLQLDQYYTDPTLSALRAERNKVVLYYTYTDPFYLYVRQEIEAIYEQIYTSQPTYALVISLAEEIATWSTIPTNSIEVADQYDKRQLMLLLQTELEYEVTAFFEANPDLTAYLIIIEQWLADRFNAGISSPAATAWFVDWQARSSQAYAAAMKPVDELSVEFFTEYPAFEEFLRINYEISELLPQFDAHQAVQRTSQMVESIENNPQIAKVYDEAYANYVQEVNTILEDSSFKIEAERYYTALNNLINSDPSYQELAVIYELAEQVLALHQQVTHDAIAICFERYSSTCDPYSDPAIVELLYGSDTLDMINAIGEFYELYDLYWYKFYHSQAYLDLEQQSQGTMQVALAPKLPALQHAQNTFTQQIEGIPQVQQLQESLADLGYLLRGQPIPTLGEQPAPASSYPYAELDSRLRRMEQLAVELSGGALVHLPVVVR